MTTVVKQNDNAFDPYYDSYAPANREMAVIHKHATQFGYEAPGESKPCQCCGLNSNKHSYDFRSTSMSKLCSFGLTIPSFFYFSNLALLGSLAVILPGIIYILRCPAMLKCFPFSCKSNAALHCYKDNSTIITVFSFLTAIILVLLRIKCFSAINKRVKQISNSVDLASQFTIYVHGITQDNLKNIPEMFMKYGVKPVAINYVYDIRNFTKEVEKLHKLEEEVFKMKMKKLTHLPKYKTLMQKFFEQKLVFAVLRSDFKTGFKGLDELFISFATDLDVGKILSRKLEISNDLNCIIKRAAEPSEIYWENYGMKPMTRFLRKLIGYSLCFTLIMVSFFAVLNIQIWFTPNKKGATMKDQAVSVSISLLITTIHILLNTVINLTAKIEAYRTITNRELSKSYKFSIVNICNKVLIPFTVNKILHLVGYKSQELGNIIQTSMIVDMLLSVVDLIDPQFFIRLVKVYMVNYSFLKGKVVLQGEANAAYEKIEILTTPLYLKVTRVMSFACFYSHFLPIAGICCFITLSVFHWINKYKMLNWARIPMELSADYSYNQIWISGHWPLLIGVGSFLINREVGRAGFMEYLLLAFCIAQFFVGEETIKKFSNSSENSNTNVKSYAKCYQNFPINYDRSNPVTKADAEAKYFAELGMNIQTTDNAANIMDMQFDAPVNNPNVDIQALTKGYFSSKTKHLGLYRPTGSSSKQASMMRDDEPKQNSFEHKNVLSKIVSSKSIPNIAKKYLPLTDEDEYQKPLSERELGPLPPLEEGRLSSVRNVVIHLRHLLDTE